MPYKRVPLLLAAMALLAVLDGAAPVGAAPPHSAVPPRSATAGPIFPPPAIPPTAIEHEVWSVSTRSLCDDCEVQSNDRLVVRRYQCGAGWRRAELNELTQASPDKVTAVIVHGYNYTADEATDAGMEFYDQLRSCAPRCSVRVVIWSWPSDRNTLSLRRDARTKACRTNTEAFYLARFLSELRSDAPVSLVGHSSCARVVTGSLHLLGGGSLRGRALFAEPLERAPMRVVLLAGALDRDWLANGRHDHALKLVDHMLVTYNPEDRVLKWYPKLEHDGPPALGQVGLMRAAQLGDAALHLAQWNVHGIVDRAHKWDDYVRSRQIMNRVRAELLFDEVESTAGTPSKSLPR